MLSNINEIKVFVKKITELYKYLKDNLSVQLDS